MGTGKAQAQPILFSAQPNVLRYCQYTLTEQLSILFEQSALLRSPEKNG